MINSVENKILRDRLKMQFENTRLSKDSGLSYRQLINIVDPQNTNSLTVLKKRLKVSAETSKAVYEKYAAPLFPDYPTAGLRRKRVTHILRKRKGESALISDYPIELQEIVSVAKLFNISTGLVYYAGACYKKSYLLLNQNICHVYTRNTIKEVEGKLYISFFVSPVVLSKASHIILYWKYRRRKSRIYILPVSVFKPYMFKDDKLKYFYIPLQEPKQPKVNIPWELYLENWTQLETNKPPSQ